MSASRYLVGTTAEIPPGSVKIVEAAGRSIGVFNVKGRYYALKNTCPHQQAPLCRGQICGTMLPGAVGEFNYGRQGEIIRCPWHGWEFEIATGRSIFNPHRMRVKTYPVSVEPGSGADEQDPSVESYPVSLEGGRVFVHVETSRVTLDRKEDAG